MFSLVFFREVIKVGKWKSCHQKREIEHFGVTMAKHLWSHARGIRETKIGKTTVLR
jgi:hypothetical protein